MFELSALGVEWGTYLLFGMMIVLLIMGKPLAYLTGFVAMFFAIGSPCPKCSVLGMTRNSP